MTPTRPPLIEALLDPARFPEPASRVDLIETHASWVLLAGDFVYKIKKAVTLPFLDYGTLQQRQICCAAELRLNQRFSPELYLAVVAIGGQPENPHFGGEGPVIEYALKMRRFPEEGRLDHLCARRELSWRHLSDLACTLADFHARASVATAASPHGTPERILAQAVENFSELRALVDDKEQPRLDALAVWTQHEFDRLLPCFVERKARGAVRECHGDLHLGNLVLIDGQVRLFDCIEFSDELRWIDVASELAFTYVDLLDHDQPNLAGWLINEWLSRSGDYDAAQVLRFYAVYRALVRAKVAAIRARQLGAHERQQETEYLGLATRLMDPPVPRLTITHGVAACGKSRAARRLLMADPCAATVCLRSDIERKRLFAMAPEADSRSPVDGGIYTPAASEQTYRHLLELARWLLGAGWSVIVDASFLERSRRDLFRGLAREAGAGFAIVAPQANPAQLADRIRHRLARGHNASEATVDVLARQQQRIEALAADEVQTVIVNHDEVPSREPNGVGAHNAPARPASIDDPLSDNLTATAADDGR